MAKQFDDAGQPRAAFWTPEMVRAFNVSARVHATNTIKITHTYLCIYCDREIPHCICGDAIEADYRDVTPSDAPQLSEPAS